MKRLLFALLLSALPVYALAAEKTVGVILTGDTPYYRAIHKAFTEELQKRGIKAQVLLQSPAPETVAWMNAVRKLVAVDVDYIVTYGGPVTAAAVSETSSIPVIYAGVFDPEALGITLKKNATGISSKVSLIGVVKMLKDMVPFERLGIVYNETEKDTVKQAGEIEALGGKFGFKPVRVSIKKFGDAVKIKDVDALMMTTSCAAVICADDVVGACRRQKIPTASAIGGAEERGVILTVSADPSEQGREAAEMLAQALAGAKPFSIPARATKKVDVVINLKEATELGVKVPIDVLTSATRVIK